MNIPTAPIEAKPRPALCIIFKTLAQTAVMWGIFLLALPMAIVTVERALFVWQLPSIPEWVLWSVFAILGGTGIYCGFLFATIGNGTPLPLDTATRFLVLGPYRWIRNPMAFCGIGQGITIGLLLRSPLVVLYAIAGAFAWHWIARPWEERDLATRFGPKYLAYRDRISNWIPSLRPYPKTIEAKAIEPETG